MVRGRRVIALALLGLAAAGLVAFSFVWNPGAPYRFLRGQPRLLTTVEGEIGGGGGGYDVQIYCWHEDFSAVRARVAKELAGCGLRELKPNPEADGKVRHLPGVDMTFWTNDGRSRYVSVVAGRARNYKEAMNLPGRDTGWVTVTVGTYLKDGPYVWIRKSLPHQEY